MNLSSENGNPAGELFPGLTVIIPCFNAGHRIRPVAEGAAARAARVIVVDDGSTDGAVAALSIPGVEVLRLPHNRGKGHAILEGLKCALATPDLEGGKDRVRLGDASHNNPNHAPDPNPPLKGVPRCKRGGGCGPPHHSPTAPFVPCALEAVCLMDADGQHDPDDIPGLVEAFRREQADLVIGQREFGGKPVPWRSRFGNRVTARVTRLLLGRNLPDTQCGFRVLSPRFAQAVVERVAGGRYETEMAMIVLAVRGGFTLAYSPVRTVYEPGNRSSHFRKVSDSARIYLRLVRVLLKRS